MSLWAFITHWITGCPDDDIEWFKDKKATCKKCGRVFFNFE